MEPLASTKKHNFFTQQSVDSTFLNPNPRFFTPKENDIKAPQTLEIKIETRSPEPHLEI